MVEHAHQRHVALPNVFNVRDLGGYATSDGRLVGWGLLYRADALHRIAGDDRAALAAIGIRTVIDLRRPEEVDAEHFAYDGIGYYHHSVQPEIWDPAAYDSSIGAARYLADRYLDMTRERGVELGAVLRLIASAESAPLVFHCAAGKDRTGVVAALTLSLLGVADQDVADDYAITGEAVPRWTAYLAAERPELLELLSTYPEPWHVAPPEAIRAFLTDLRAEHGSVERYAAQVGVDSDTVEGMRAHLLTDA